MNHKASNLALAAAFAGLLSGTTARLNAQPVSGHEASVSGAAIAAGVAMTAQDDQKLPKHSCKGKNDCKGQGGCKSSDNGCKGKNSCKGKGGCATDGSKPPSVV